MPHIHSSVLIKAGWMRDVLYLKLRLKSMWTLCGWHHFSSFCSSLRFVWICYIFSRLHSFNAELNFRKLSPFSTWISFIWMNLIHSHGAAEWNMIKYILILLDETKRHWNWIYLHLQENSTITTANKRFEFMIWLHFMHIAYYMHLSMYLFKYSWK